MYHSGDDKWALPKFWKDVGKCLNSTHISYISDPVILPIGIKNLGTVFFSQKIKSTALLWSPLWRGFPRTWVCFLSHFSSTEIISACQNVTSTKKGAFVLLVTASSCLHLYLGRWWGPVNIDGGMWCKPKCTLTYRLKNKNRETNVLTMVHPRSKEHAIIKNQQNKLNRTSGKCSR